MKRTTLCLLLHCVTLAPAAAGATGACDLAISGPNAGGLVTPRAEAVRVDEVITEALRGIEVTPGIAVGIVENDELVYARGFGRRDLESCEPITQRTRFYLLSVTKSFFGMGAALLHEEGAIHLDTPLSQAFEGLAMQSPINPDQTSLRDLLTHRAGFWSGGINYRSAAPGNLTDDQLIDLLRTHARPAPIEFRYSNMGYLIAGAAIEKLTGIGWRDLLETKVFEPAEMTDTTTSIDRASVADFARPYARRPSGGFDPRPVKRQAQMHAAGGAASNVLDLARWIRINLRTGRLGARPVYPARAVRQAHAPQIQYDWKFGPYHRYAYGLGIHNAELDGELTLHHFGGPIHVSFQPDRDRGVVVLSAGTDSTRFVHELAALLYDLLDGRDPATLSDHFDETRIGLEERLDARRELRAELKARRRPLARDAGFYAGSYRSDRLGDIVLSVRDGSVHLRYGVIEQDLVPLERDTFEADLMPGGGSVDVLEFRLDEVGEALFWGERRFDRLDRTSE